VVELFRAKIFLNDSVFRKIKTYFNIKTEGFKFLVEVAGKVTLVIYLVWKKQTRQIVDDGIRVWKGKLAKLWMMAFAYLSTCYLFFGFPSPHWKVSREGIVRHV
jgi:hypothetical protein